MIIMTSLEKMADEESSGDEYEWDPPNNKCVRELKCLVYFVLLEHDVTGLIVTLMNKLGVFKYRWNLKFNLERRLLHLIICVLITLVIQVSFHVRNDLCTQRRRCYMDGCDTDYGKREIPKRENHSQDTFPSEIKNITVESKLYGKCEPIPTSVMHIGSSKAQWFVYPKPTMYISEEWSHCSLLAHAAAQPNICPDGIVCIPACKGSEDFRTFAPDHRPNCSTLSNILRKISGRDLENTLLCVVPNLPCYSHEFNEHERRIIVATAYQIVSLVVRLLLVCGCVHNPATRRRYRRLGYALCIAVVGLTGGIYAFALTELTYFPTWITDAVISFIGGLLIQLLWIIIFSWYVLGSCSGECCQVRRKQIKSKPDGYLEHFKLEVMHAVSQVCDDRRHKVHQYESPFEGVMTVCGQKSTQETTEEVRSSSSSYDTIATDDDEKSEWSDSQD